MLSRVRPQCRRPLAFHPLKTRKDYLIQWGAFSRDENHTRRLAAKGLSCGSVQAEVQEEIERARMQKIKAKLRAARLKVKVVARRNDTNETAAIVKRNEDVIIPNPHRETSGCITSMC